MIIFINVHFHPISFVITTTLAGIGKTAVFDIEKGKLTVRFDTLTAILNVLNIRIQLSSPLIGDWPGQERGDQS